MEESKITTQQQSHTDPDEINLLEYFYVLLKNKWLIIGLTILGFVGGHIAAIIKGPVYIADAVITPKEAESVKTPDLSGLGMFGGMVMSQLNVGGNASLGKIELILDSRTFNAELVEKKSLLPFIYPEQWDSVEKRWQEDFIVPQLTAVGGYVKGEFLDKEINKNGTMTISIESEDSLFSYKLLSAYLEYLDTYIRKNVQEDAKENRDYLESQLFGVTDPLLGAKIQELIAKEVEKMMVVSKEAFKIIDSVFVYKSFKEKKLYPLVFAFGLFFLTVLFVVFGHAFFSAEKNEEDRGLIQNIWREMFRIPFVR